MEVGVIDYYFDSTMDKVTVESVTIWMLLATLTALFAYILYRRGRIKASTVIILPLLVFYLSFILTITILERIPTRLPRYQLDLFWLYKAIMKGTKKLLAVNFWNVMLFVPLAAMLAILFDARIAYGRRHWIWLVILICFLFSTGVEVIQLVTHRGLFEFDDIVHNTLGAAIGVIAVAMIRGRTD